MKAVAYAQSSSHVRLGAVVAVGAVTLLWSGTLSAALFPVGTLLLVICLMLLARGFGARGGTMLGLLLGMVWLAARLGFTRHLDAHTLFTELNILAVLSMMTMGGLAGTLFGPAEDDRAVREPFNAASNSASVSESASSKAIPSGMPAYRADVLFSHALARHREWMEHWGQSGYPWTSFDNHVRELVRMLSGMHRLRCYRVGAEGQLFAMAHESNTEEVESPSKDLLTHVLTTGRRFLANAASSGPLVQVLAESGNVPLAWAVPIRDGNVTVGLITAESVDDPTPSEAYLEAVADLIEQLWLHVHHLESLRLARQTDRGSGLINRTDFMPALRATLEECYRLHEPVVVMIVCLEGLRGLDDASEWAKRDELVEKVGQTIAAGLRKDDIVGRFSDAQFVALLRRLDIPLAELICRKLLSNIARVICDFELTAWVTPRAGLSGSGFTKVPVEELLSRSISALGTARGQDMLLVSARSETAREDIR